MAQEELSDFQINYINFMRKLGDMYIHFTNELLKKNEGYQGLGYREAVKKFENSAYTSQFKKIIKDHPQESRKEWLIWMMERAGKKNSNNNDWQFWQQHNKPIEIRDKEMFDKTLEYIHQNPVKAGFVTRPEDWKYSSACDFCGMEGLVELSYS